MNALSDKLDVRVEVEVTSGSCDVTDTGVEVELTDQFDVAETGKDDEVTDAWVDALIAVMFCREWASIQA